MNYTRFITLLNYFLEYLFIALLHEIESTRNGPSINYNKVIQMLILKKFSGCSMTMNGFRSILDG